MEDLRFMKIVCRSRGEGGHENNQNINNNKIHFIVNKILYKQWIQLWASKSFILKITWIFGSMNPLRIKVLTLSQENQAAFPDLTENWDISSPINHTCF